MRVKFELTNQDPTGGINCIDPADVNACSRKGIEVGQLFLLETELNVLVPFSLALKVGRNLLIARPVSPGRMIAVLN